MLISYNWLKWYIPEVPEVNKLVNIFNYHLCEVESMEESPDGDIIFDIKVLPNRAHDLLSHQGIGRELASLLNISYVDPTPKYKIPESISTDLQINIQTENCRRYMGRIVRNVKVGPSPEWVVKHLESIGQRSINNMVDAANIVMFDCGQPTHIFDLDKISSTKDSPSQIIIRQAVDGEEMTTLDNKQVKFDNSNMVIADSEKVLAIAGVKGGNMAEVDENTKNIIIEVANFDPISVRKTAQALNIFTDARKRYENDLSPELCSYAMRELSALVSDVCPESSFEDMVDIYPQKQIEKKLNFSLEKVSSILGIKVSSDEVKDILKRYNFTFSAKGGPASGWEIIVPSMRLDLEIEEDMAEEIGRIMGYDKVVGKIPKIDFKIKQNEIYNKILYIRHKLLNDGYSEVMTSSFSDKGDVEVLASASDKNFLRTNLTDGLNEAMKLNKINAPLLGLDEVKIFEIGTVFTKNGEEMNVAYGNKKEIKEMKLSEYITENVSLEEHGYFSTEKFLVEAKSRSQVSSREHSLLFTPWSLFPFIARDVSLWVPEEITNEQVAKVIKDNAGELVVRGPELFDEFKKDGKVSYAFRIVFQSFDRTLTDIEINEIMEKINQKITEHKDWQVR